MEVEEEEGAQSCPQRPGNVGLWDIQTDSGCWWNNNVHCTCRWNLHMKIISRSGSHCVMCTTDDNPCCSVYMQIARSFPHPPLRARSLTSMGRGLFFFFESFPNLCKQFNICYFLTRICWILYSAWTEGVWWYDSRKVSGSVQRNCVCMMCV